VKTGERQFDGSRSAAYTTKIATAAANVATVTSTAIASIEMGQMSVTKESECVPRPSRTGISLRITARKNDVVVVREFFVADGASPPALPAKLAFAAWPPEKLSLLLSDRQYSRFDEVPHPLVRAMKTHLTPRSLRFFRP